MITTVGEIGLKLVLNSSGFSKSLNAVQEQANSVSNKMSAKLKKLGTAVVAAFSVAAVKNFGQQCIESAADVNAANSQFEQTFGSMQSQAESAIATVSKNSGILKTRLQGVGTSIYAFAKTTGMDSADALNMMQEALQVTADSAAYYDRSLEDTAESLKSFLKGNFENDAALGLSCTETTRNAAANKLYGKSFTELSESQKQLTLLEMVKDANKLSGAMGQASRESDGWENVTGNLKESWNQLLAVVGKPILQVATNIVQKLSSAIAKLTEYAKNAVNSLSDLFNFDGSNTASNISTAANAAQGLSDEASNSSTALDNVASSAEKAKRSIAGFDKLNILTKADTTATDTTQSGSTTVNNGSVTSTVSKKTNSLTQSKTLESFKTALTNIKGVVSSIGTSWKNVWNNGTGKKFLENINSLLDTAFSTIGDIAGAFKKAWDKAGLGDSVVQSFIDKWNSLVELVNTIGGTFREVWNDGKGEKIWGNILDIIRNCNNFTETLRNKIKEAWDKNNTGKKIWENILGIVEDITGFLDDMSQIRLEWLEDLNLDPVAKAVETLSGAFRELLKACGDKLKQAYKTILLPLAKWTIEKVVPDLLNAFAGALKAISDIIKKISPSVLKAVAGGIGAVATAVLAFKTGKAIASSIGKVTSAIQNIGKVMSANALLAIASAITAIVVAIEAYNDYKWNNSSLRKELDKTQELTDKWKSLSDEMSSKMDELNDTQLDMKVNFDNVDKLKERLQEIISDGTIDEDEKGEYKTIVDLLSEKVNGFDEQWNTLTLEEIDGKIVIEDNIDEVSENLDDLVNQWEIAQAKLTLSSMYSDLSTAKAKKEIEVEALLKENNTDEATKEFIDEIYNQSKLSKDEAKILANELIKQKGDLTKTAQELQRKLDSGTLNKNVYKNLYDTIGNNFQNFYTPEGSIRSLFWNIGATDRAKSAAANIAEMTDEQQKGQDALDGYSQKLEETGDSLSVLNGGTKDYSKYIKLVNDDILSQDAVLSLLKDDNITTWEELEAAASNSVKMSSNKVKKSSSSIISDNENTQGVLIGSKDKFNELGDTVQTSSSKSADSFSKNTSKITSSTNSMIGKMQKALTPIKNVFSNAFSPIYDILKTPLNNALTGLENFINGFISAINKMLSGVDTVANSIGKLFGQEWHAGRLNKVTLPRLAKGGLVKAPTLAVVGDNAGANSGNPEVIAPLNKLQGMLDNSGGQDTVILGEILSYLKKLYEMFVIFRNNGGNYYQFVAEINGNDIFNEIVKQNELYKNRHNGKSAFA